jgi:hypothetical protein
MLTKDICAVQLFLKKEDLDSEFACPELPELASIPSQDSLRH